MQFESLLIANRGEIAVRIIRTAKALGLRTVAVYSDSDAGAPHVQMADDAVLIGGGPAADSYLNTDKVIAAARQSGAQAVHPGYGFLSEDSEFAQRVVDEGLVFIGPSPQAIRKMGNKAEAKRLMTAAGVLCVPGYKGEDQSDAVLTHEAQKIGLPVMVKAAAGGGGRGMRLVEDDAELATAIALARSEAGGAFGSGQLIIEKALIAPRHVEVQIFADQQGNCIHLGERDCSVQRRHQKLVEEAPCPILNSKMRTEMGAAAVSAAKAVEYCGAGTVEFLLDSSGAFYFLEMNTRLQVEHPVTECITGLDLVALQLSIANGDPLPIVQDDVRLNGHAIEARLCAEDPTNDFLPCTGRIALWHPASGPGVRIDAGIESGQLVTQYYDSMLAKVIAWGESREDARVRLITALTETVLLGIPTNMAFLIDALGKTEFAEGRATTAFVKRNFPDGFVSQSPSNEDIALAASVFAKADQHRNQSKAGYSSKSLLGWSSAVVFPVPITLTADDVACDCTVSMKGDICSVSQGESIFVIQILKHQKNQVTLVVENTQRDFWYAQPSEYVVNISFGQHSHRFERHSAESVDPAAGGNRVVAPMPGQIVDIVATTGQRVQAGDTLAVLEAMKMQHRILAEIDGTVKSVGVKKGDQLGSGDLIAELEE